MPLIEEAYTVFVACTFLLASLLELCARSDHHRQPASISHTRHLSRA